VPAAAVAEERLKEGRLKAVVATASLELGIDIGTLDLVCQIGSPRSIAVALQRIGRSGHQVEHTTKPKGRIFATTRDELIECAALVRSISTGELDRLLIPMTPLDVLAQQVVAMSATDDWHEDDLFALVRRALPSRSHEGRLRTDRRDALGHQHEARAAGAYLHRDRVRSSAAGAARAAGGDHVRRRDPGQRTYCPCRARRNRRGHAR
jgi:ATP-dependent Lhr-like helicase